MSRKLLGSIALAGTALAGAFSPAVAQNYYGERRGSYEGRAYAPDYDEDDQYRADRQAEDYRRYQDQRRSAYYAQRNAANRGYGYQGYSPANAYRQRNQGYQCHSGTTGGVVGAIVGGLLGREIGRGGFYNRPSTTGAIIGAGAGALAGRAIGRSGSSPCRSKGNPRGTHPARRRGELPEGHPGLPAAVIARPTP